MYNKKSLYIAGFTIITFFCTQLVFAGTLSCSITTSAACSDTIVLRLSGSSNAHAELSSQANANYNGNVICCSGVTGLSNSCSGTYATVLKLESVTNSHVQENSQSGYANSVCLQVPSGGSVSIGYQSTNCSGYDTTLGSIESVTDSHIGDTTAYTTKICGTAGTLVNQALSFAISTNTVYFGQLTSVGTRYASSTNINGDGNEVQAHALEVNTNAASGYNVTVQGATLTSQQNSSNTISPLASNTSPSTGVEQFGLRMTASGGTGTVSAPYAASGFAYTSDANTPSQVASAVSGDSATTTYSVRYMANIGATTEAGSYTANLVYVATANF